jgi:hypothetical protein
LLPLDVLFAVGAAGSVRIGLTVAVNGVQEVIPDVFEMNITGLSPSRIELLAGTNQAAPVNESFAAPLLVKVLDELGAPVPGAVVQFENPEPCNPCGVPPPGWPRGILDPSTGYGVYRLVAADDRGIATSPRFRANQAAGQWTMWVAAFSAPFASLGAPRVYTPMTNLSATSVRGRLSATKAAIESDGSAPFDVGVRLVSSAGLPMANQTVRFELSHGNGPAILSPALVMTDAQGYAYTRAYPNGASSTYEIWALWQDQLASIKVNRVEEAAAPASMQDMWWAGPGENGWGLSIAQSGNNLFPVIYGYDASGHPTWLVMPSGNWNSARTVFSGLLYSPQGSPFFAYDLSRFQAGAPVGVGTLTFTGHDTAELELTVDGASTRKSISRQVFGAGAATGPAVGGMWWGGPAQNGWGVSIMQQGSELFSVWYTYDASGRAVWYVLPGGDWTSPSSYEGRAFKTSGSPLAAYDPARLRISDVGSYRLRFDGDAATLEYAIEGRSGTLSLTRQAF